MRDRICKDCGARYTPPMPSFLPYVIVVIGVCLAFFGIAAMFGGELMKGPVKFRLWAKVALAIVGLVFVGAGVQLARKKKP
jgi:threonine/homoserine/homoserine lactone efflux protein